MYLQSDTISLSTSSLDYPYIWILIQVKKRFKNHVNENLWNRYFRFSGWTHQLWKWYWKWNFSYQVEVSAELVHKLEETKNKQRSRTFRFCRWPYFSPIFLIGKKNHPLNIWVFLMFTCQFKMSESECLENSEIQNFSSSNCRKFAVEWDWNSKISQIRIKIRGFWKKEGVFFQKTLNVSSKLVKVANLLQNANQIILFLFHRSCNFFPKKSGSFRIKKHYKI